MYLKCFIKINVGRLRYLALLEALTQISEAKKKCRRRQQLLDGWFSTFALSCLGCFLMRCNLQGADFRASRLEVINPSDHDHKPLHLQIILSGIKTLTCPHILNRIE
jgi:hypothetical protein